MGPSGLGPREGAGLPKVTQPRRTEAADARFPTQCAPAWQGLPGVPALTAHLAHPAASGSIAPAGAGAWPGPGREAPPEPQPQRSGPTAAAALPRLRPASLEFGSGLEGAGGASRS